MNRNSLRIAAAVISLSTLSGCGALGDLDLFDPKFWSLPRNSSNTYAELGLAELSKGNNVEARAYFERALQSNEFDIHALYGLGVMYQNTGQPERARRMYQAILSIDPRPTEEIMVWADKRTQPIVDLANVNMHLLDSMPGAPAAQYDAMAPQQPSFMGAPQAQPRSPVTSMYGGGTMMPSKPTVSMRPSLQQSMQAAAPQQMFQEGDLNIVERFETLRALLDQGLLTQDEFLVRRKVNVGALLPLTSQPPGAGLGRPVPAVGQISDRSNAIGRALEMRALSPAQHTAERTMILDALMPANPVAMASPALPPKGLMEAADAVRRLELLKEADLITSDEYSKERQAIEGGIQPAGQSSSAMGGPPKAMEAKSMKPKVSGFQPAVHLASYRQRKAAERGWAELSRRFGSLLGGMEHRIERVDLGGGDEEEPDF